MIVSAEHIVYSNASGDGLKGLLGKAKDSGLLKKGGDAVKGLLKKKGGQQPAGNAITAPDPTPTVVPDPPKSKTGLYIGLGVGVIVIGGIIFAIVNYKKK